jgi:hypothetical protein
LPRPPLPRPGGRGNGWGVGRRIREEGGSAPEEEEEDNNDDDDGGYLGGAWAKWGCPGAADAAAAVAAAGVVAASVNDAAIVAAAAVMAAGPRTRMLGGLCIGGCLSMTDPPSGD